MDNRHRIVTQTPLAELWNSEGPIAATRERPLGAAEIADLLRAGPVSFVCANVGHPLRWIPEPEHFDLWKREVKPHLAQPDEKVSLDDFPGGYCYFATEWARPGGPPVVLLEMHH